MMVFGRDWITDEGRVKEILSLRPDDSLREIIEWCQDELRMRASPKNYGAWVVVPGEILEGKKGGP